MYRNLEELHLFPFPRGRRNRDDDDDDDAHSVSTSFPILATDLRSIFVVSPLSSLPSLITKLISAMKRSGRKRPPSRGRVVWDEENLQDLETSKTPKQKITEPKTPYYAPDGAGDGGLSPTPHDDGVGMDSASHAEAVRHALSEVTIEDGASSSRSSGSSWNLSEDELDYMERDDEGSQSEGNHSGSFEEHRRKHYDNEFRKAKLLASQSELAAEEEEAAANGEAESAESQALNRPRQQ